MSSESSLLDQKLADVSNIGILSPPLGDETGGVVVHLATELLEDGVVVLLWVFGAVEEGADDVAELHGSVVGISNVCESLERC